MNKSIERTKAHMNFTNESNLEKKSHRTIPKILNAHILEDNESELYNNEHQNKNKTTHNLTQINKNPQHCNIKIRTKKKIEEPK